MINLVDCCLIEVEILNSTFVILLSGGIFAILESKFY